MNMGATEMRDKAERADRLAGALMAAAAETNRYEAAGAVAAGALMSEAKRLREEHDAWDDAATLLDAVKHIHRVAGNPPSDPVFSATEFQQAMQAVADRLVSKASDITDPYHDPA